MAQSKDLTPNFSKSPTAAQAIYTPPSTNDLATMMGGIFMNRNSFTRGQGNNVFGSDQNGLWVGAADYKDAPWTLDYTGQETIRAVDGSGNTSFFNSKVLGFSIGTLWSIIIGDPTALPTL